MWEEYLFELSRVKLLSEEEEQKLWREFKDNNSESARERLIESYQPLVFKIVSGFKCDENLVFDLLQEGSVALINAVDEYDYKRGVKFYTFAYWKIKGIVLNYLSRKVTTYAELDENVEQEVVSIGEEVEDEALRDVVRDSLRLLSEKESKILHSIFIEGLKPREVAVDFGLTTARVYKIKRRAMDRLRKMLSSFWKDWNS